MPFGKYNGANVSDIAGHNPHYIVWLVEECLLLREPLKTEVEKFYDQAKKDVEHIEIERKRK